MARRRSIIWEKKKSDSRTAITPNEAYPVYFDDPHFVTINPKKECGQSRCVDDSKAVGFSWLER